jgi:lysozyme family protein
VRVHDDARARGLLDALDARGLALGEQVALAGRAEPALLAHELAHVLQQRRDGATPQFKPKEPSAASPGVDPRFWEWWKLVVGFEGSLEAWKAQPANAADKGGETNWGVTTKMYLAKAQALGLPATEAGFAALKPEQAMRFGQMMWKASGASRIDNTGVALVLADWYWGGILLKHLTAILAARGFKATYAMGSPSKATTDFINTLPPGELVQEMSDAKAGQYRGHVKADPKQKPFLRGWLERNETRRKQAQPFVAGVAAPAAGAERQSLWERGQRALRLAARAESAPERQAAKAALADAIDAIARRAEAGFAHAEEEMAMKALRDELLDARRRLGDA